MVELLFDRSLRGPDTREHFGVGGVLGHHPVK